jgi:hypothetical protein
VWVCARVSVRGAAAQLALTPAMQLTREVVQRQLACSDAAVGFGACVNVSVSVRRKHKTAAVAASCFARSSKVAVTHDGKVFQGARTAAKHRRSWSTLRCDRFATMLSVLHPPPPPIGLLCARCTSKECRQHREHRPANRITHSGAKTMRFSAVHRHTASARGCGRSSAVPPRARGAAAARHTMCAPQHTRTRAQASPQHARARRVEVPQNVLHMRAGRRALPSLPRATME